MMKELSIDTTFGSVFGRMAGEPSAPLVLCIHGWSQRNGWHTWQPMMTPLAEAGFCVVSVDMPGWGQSVAASPDPLMGERATGATLEILDGLEATPAVLMGKSWGGGVALSLALKHPDRVSKLILTAPAFRELDQLATLKQPVLLAWAQDDPVIPYQFAEQFASAISDVKLVTYKTGGHSAAPKNANDFAPVAIEFLKREK